jgi:NAD/NADP transhydrogenase beta subunit
MKTFGGVVLGYLMMFAFVFLSLSVAYRIMGADLAFQPGVYDVTNLWIITSFMLGLAGAILGGYMCEAIARDERAPKLLAVLVLLLGFAFAVPVLTTTSPSAPREGDVSHAVAMQNARQPPWVALLNPLFGAIGVLIGAGARRGRSEAPSDPVA